MARVGRPTVQDKLRDPSLAAKAVKYRLEGRSWGEIATLLNVGRSTARRLALSQNSTDEPEVAIGGASEIRTPSREGLFRNGTKTVPNEGMDERVRSGDTGPAHDDSGDNDGLPEAFRLFGELLRRAGDKGQKAK